MSSGVEFEGDNTQYSRPRPQQSASAPQASNLGPGEYSYTKPQAKGLEGWLIRRGLAKSEKGAQIFMGVIIAVNIAITYIMIKYFL